MKKPLIIFLTAFLSITPLSSTIVNAQTVSPTVTTTPTTSNKLLQAEQNQTTRMQNIISKADGYITERIASINNMINYINSSKVASSSQAQSDLTDLNSTLTGLSVLKGKIDAFNDPSNIKNGLLPLVQEIFTTYRVYAIELPKDHMLLHIAVLNTLNQNFTAAEQNLTQDINFAQGQGKDIATLQSDNTKYSNDLAKFNGDVQTAQAALNTIAPSDYVKGQSAFNKVKADFATVHTDAMTVHSDFNQFVKDFKSLFNL